MYFFISLFLPGIAGRLLYIIKYLQTCTVMTFLSCSSTYYQSIDSSNVFFLNKQTIRDNN